MWLCQCDCGKQSLTCASNLFEGQTKSCGCFRIETRGRSSRTHGRSHSPVWGVWRAMINRCTNPNVFLFHRYGGRGISVCPRWRKSFSDFISDMGERPSGGSIDRINNDGNYEPGNCKWSTRKEQCRNRKTNRIITFQGKTASIAEWAEIIPMSPLVISHRLFRGWSVEMALTKPLRTWPKKRVS